jgi:hypothetical protein
VHYLLAVASPDWPGEVVGGGMKQGGVPVAMNAPLTVLILDRESRANRLLCIFKKAISAVTDLIADRLERGPELVLVLFGA